MTMVRSVPLAPYTTLRVGGLASLITVTSEAELDEALTLARTYPSPPFFLGSGSNVLVSDQGYDGLVIMLQLLGTRYHSESLKTIDVTVGAGVSLDDLVADTVTRGYWGLENLSSIPGSVGATPIQNVGAYGVEVSDRIVSVSAVDSVTGTLHHVTNEACAFGYRDSWFKSPAGRQYVVTAVTYRLSKIPRPQLSYADLAERFTDASRVSVEDIRHAVVRIRAAKFPDWQKVGTAGSFFKNPIIPRATYEALCLRHPGIPGHHVSESLVKVSLGYVLDHICHLRGHQSLHVGLSSAQALVLVTDGQATAREIDAYATWVERTVAEKTMLTIEREVQMIGTWK